ncbi:MAG TPA: NADPH:quinone oxidoreductase family protein [Thermoanaerobaculia bacterium]
MRAVLLTRYGGAEVLRIVDVPLPEPRRGEVRVRIEFIGVNFAEVLSRRGVYGWAPRLPYIPGMEASGVVDAVGEGVTTLSRGDAVIVGTQYGTYAEFICQPADRVLPAPRDFSPAESAAFGVNYLTAWIGLMEMARLRPSDTLLVTSAAGGVGTAAVQIGARFGARVIGASGRGKQDVVRELGAAAALDYDDPRWEQQLERATGGRGVDVALEMAGGRIYRAAVRSLAPMGRIVIAGASSGFARSRNPLARLAALRNVPWPWVPDMVRRSYGVLNFHVGWLLDSGVIRPQWDALVRFVEQHHIRPVVGHEFAFDDIAEAHRTLEERRNIGKVVVRVSNASP